MDLNRRARPHGGPDRFGAVRWDFSTNANAAGPCAAVLHAVAAADATRYPDPGYDALRARLADFHRVDSARIVFAASASEFIQRVTAVGERLSPGAVEVPAAAYGDYALAARACGRPVVERHAASTTPCTLRWFCDPASPDGAAVAPPKDPDRCPTVLDAAYAPLRLDGSSCWPAAALDAVFRLFTPNKALGLPGIRGAYAIAPAAATWPVSRWCEALDAAGPSWPLGAHAVVLLERWTDPSTQAWLGGTLPALRAWTAQLRDGLDALDLAPQPGVAPFVCARRPARAEAGVLRAEGLAVRDTASFGLPGWMRVSAQLPDAIDLLLRTLGRLR